MAENPETKIQRQIIKALNTLPGCHVYRNNSGGVDRGNGVIMRFGLCPGASDLIGWYKGRFLAVEVKRPGGKPTDLQQQFIDRVNAGGGLAFVAHDAKGALDRLINPS